jgi:hypothetical protein
MSWVGKIPGHFRRQFERRVCLYKENDRGTDHDFAALVAQFVARGPKAISMAMGTTSSWLFWAFLSYNATERASVMASLTSSSPHTGDFWIDITCEVCKWSCRFHNAVSGHSRNMDLVMIRLATDKVIAFKVLETS